ncbi:MAG: nuclear transport factor 2 family protein [Myxococcota bacterium]
MLLPEQAVLEANQAFYDAFAHGDLAGMEEIWARDASVVCTHPGWPTVRGRVRVLQSWRAIFDGGAPPVMPREVEVVRLEDVAVVVCAEVIGAAQLMATNLFVREHGLYRLIHHHASPVAGPVVVGGGPPSSPPDDGIPPDPHSLN